jgi:hypothetical protein
MKNILFLIAFFPVILFGQLRADQLPEITDPVETDAFYSAERGSFQKITLARLRALFESSELSSLSISNDTLFAYTTTPDTIFVVLPDASPTNEIQALSISNDTLFLSDGGFVKLPGGGMDDMVPVVSTIDTALNFSRSKFYTDFIASDNVVFTVDDTNAQIGNYIVSRIDFGSGYLLNFSGAGFDTLQLYNYVEGDTLFGVQQIYFEYQPWGVAVNIPTNTIVAATPDTPAEDVDLVAELGSKLYMWQKDGRDAANVTESAGTVSAWLDASGNTRSLTQGTVGRQPTRGADGLVFDGADDFLTITGISRGIFELHFLVREESSVATDRIIEFGSAGTGRYMVQQQTSGGNNVYSYATSSSTFNTGNTAGFDVYSIVSNGAESSFKINGTNVDFDLGTMAINSIFLATRSTSSGTQCAEITMREMVITDLLTDTERAQVIARLTYVNEN